MQKPTYQQISDLYHELWEIQRKLEDAESKSKQYKESYLMESQYCDRLMEIIYHAHNALNDGKIELAIQELEKA